ncbi:metallophosphoesterase family protein [Bacillus sp. FSL K6-3431]|uniref:metallophosphoesterase family protein n=1 Tax=Bacillus sp. FSL K6-3431 TaxID=2921500 RepID=UPI0030FC7922
MESKLMFRKDRSFKIIQFTDLHVSGEDDHKDDARTFTLISESIQQEQPDLIVITGDLIWSEGVNRPDNSYRKVLDHISQWDIPFAIVYGNHDTEEGITRKELHLIQEGYHSSVSITGPENIHGVGNYSLAIQSATGEENEALLYFLDSGALAPEDIGGYEWIHSDQVNWFVSESQKYAKVKEKPAPALAFFHIPIPEYNEVLQVGKVSGIRMEKVCAPKINSGLFTALLESGDVMGTFVGHDHDNDYCGELYGISLCYGRVSGYNTYGELQRGARVIRLFEGERRFESWIRLDNGEITSFYTHNKV